MQSLWKQLYFKIKGENLQWAKGRESVFKYSIWDSQCEILAHKKKKKKKGTHKPRSWLMTKRDRRTQQDTTRQRKKEREDGKCWTNQTFTTPTEEFGVQNLTLFISTSRARISARGTGSRLSIKPVSRFLFPTARFECSTPSSHPRLPGVTTRANIGRKLKNKNQTVAQLIFSTFAHAKLIWYSTPSCALGFMIGFGTVQLHDPFTASWTYKIRGLSVLNWFCSSMPCRVPRLTKLI